MSPDRCDIAVVEAGVSWSPTLPDAHEHVSSLAYSFFPSSFYVKFPQDPRNIPSSRTRPRNIIICSLGTRQLLARRSNKPRNHTKNDLTRFPPPVLAFRKFPIRSICFEGAICQILGHDNLMWRKWDKWAYSRKPKNRDNIETLNRLKYKVLL